MDRIRKAIKAGVVKVVKRILVYREERSQSELCTFITLEVVLIKLKAPAHSTHVFDNLNQLCDSLQFWCLPTIVCIE